MDESLDHLIDLELAVGAGAALLDVYQALWDQAQVAFPGGSCATVGIAGLTLGGGFGLLSRQLGLTCDALLEAEMVTADGEIVRASDRENRDLLWALRGGGGGNFGIVTELVFRVHPVTNVSLCNLGWTFDQMPAALRAWQSWAPAVDRRLVSVLMLPRAPGSIGVLCQLNGPTDRLAALVQPLVDAGYALTTPPYSLSFIESVRQLGNPLGPLAGAGIDVPLGAAGGMKFKNSSGYGFASFPDAAIAELVAQLEAAPGRTTSCRLTTTAAPSPKCRRATPRLPLGGQVRPAVPGLLDRRRRRGPQHRLDPRGAHDAGTLHRRRVRELHRRRHRRFPAAYYGDNFRRRTRVKRAWDPRDVFHFAQSIPPR